MQVIPRLLAPFQQLAADKADIDQKLANLDALLFTSRSVHLSEQERDLLLRQRAAMQDYSEALGERILRGVV